jgi:foldase protein PrsA
LRTTAGRTLVAALAAALLIPAGTAGAQLPPDAVAATGLVPISRQLFDHWLRIAAHTEAPPGRRFAVPLPPDYRACIEALPHGAPVTRRRANCAAEYRALRDQTMQTLISSAWIEGEAALQGIALTDAEVRAEEIGDRRATFPLERDFQRFLRTSGMKLEDVLRRERTQLLADRLRKKAQAPIPVVTDAEVHAYYAAHLDRFRIPERRDARIVLTRHAWQARQALGLLRAGVPWKRVARAFSLDRATRDGGGRLIGMTPDGSGRTLGRAVFAARRHVLSGPLRTPRGFYVFEVSRIRPGRQLPEAEESRAIGDLLRAQREELALHDFVQDFQQRWKAITLCRSGFVTEDCGGVSPRR